MTHAEALAEMRAHHREHVSGTITLDEWCRRVWLTLRRRYPDAKLPTLPPLDVPA